MLNLSLPEVINLFEASSELNDSEQIVPLLWMQNARLEWIASYGQASEDEFWYEQAQDEWVLLAKGCAVLRFEGNRDLLLQAGDCLTLPAGLKHRVQSCSDDAVWIALHGDLKS